jgi:colanic acid/amylovoran biosynthesis glycosyltransferase
MRIDYLISQYPATSHTFIHREVEAPRARGVEIDTFSI